MWWGTLLMKRRVLLVTDVSAEVMCSEAEYILGQHARALQAAGISFSILSRQPESGAPLKASFMEGVEEYRLPYDGDRGWRGLVQVYYGARKWWKEYGSGFDMVVAEQPLIMWALVKAGCHLPCLQFCYDFAYEDYSIHHNSDWHWYQAFLVAVIRKLESGLYRRASRLFVLSEYSHRRLGDVFSITDGIHVALGGATPIDDDLFSARPSLRMELNFKNSVVVSVCNLVPRSGVDLLVQAAVICRYSQPDLRWVIIGTGPLLEPLRHLVKELGVDDRIEFTGSIGDEDKKKRLVSADLFMLPSRAMESFGLIVLEANSCGLPVIATPVGINVELIQSLPFPNRLSTEVTPEALAQAVDDMLEDRESLDHEAMRQNLRAATLQHDWTIHNANFMKCICDVGS